MTPAPSFRNSLPPLDAHEQVQCDAVRARLAQAIATAGGWIPFSVYQRIALYEPGLGYYSAGAHKLGALGDFTTAPEIAPLFGRVLARWLAPMLQALGDSAEILELGPGSGALAVDVLTALARCAALPKRYLMLDVSADLRERQQRRLQQALGAALAARAAWPDRLPERLCGFVLANEVLDALPCERFVVAGGRPAVLGVADAGGTGAFSWQTRPVAALADAALRAAYDELAVHLAALPEPLPDGYVGEFQPTLPAFVASLAERLTKGCLVIVDYGLPRAQLYHPRRAGGMLRCYRRHRVHDDPFREPGLTDISTWVDFSAVAAAGARAGLELTAFCTQAAWLLAGGIESELAALLAQTSDTASRIALVQAVKRLLLPAEMGESLKFMILARDCAEQDASVAFQDLRDTL
ncbi:MAG: SAM-dependent methyltransferase [Steroidobacteraceae bacterium]|nr:SAM-dependent methyltransferase [Steroidobacteraceae bacterium]MDW8259344.1 SAM-dependent methyltransferase [Gammaproteobacteria bacterium]